MTNGFIMGLSNGNMVESFRSKNGNASAAGNKYGPGNMMRNTNEDGMMNYSN